MYGMVNKALEEMIVASHGEKAWESIKEKAGVDVDVFISSEGYSDAMTYSLVGAASEILGAPAAEILESFGVHWVTKTAEEGYSDMMAAGGKTLADFLRNLPNFHARVSMVLPHLSPPRFQCSDVEDRSVRMHYFSDRPGLAPFVTGLFKGLGQRFATPVSIVHAADKSSGAAHDEFVISW